MRSHQEWRDPAIPNWDPRWDWWDPAGIPPNFLHGSVTASEPGSKIALFCSTISCTPGSLNFDTYV